MKKAISIGVLVIFFSIFFNFSFAHLSLVHAQTIGTASLDGIDISSSPANPSPGSKVTITVQSYTTNLSGAVITWTVNGKTYSSGIGVDSITITAPAAGQTTKIMADIQTLEGADVEKLISITSGDVDMVWETSGYTPPLYLGKTPFVYQNTVTVIAVPHLVDSNGNSIDPKNLIYQWKENTFILGSQSGYGKQSIQITGSIIGQPLDIDVAVASPDGSAHAETEMTVQPVSPSIVFYQDDPLYGVLYNSAINGTLRLIHNQTKVTASPYGFDIYAAGVSYDWNINGIQQNNLSTSRNVVLGVNAGQQGTSNIDLSIQNTAEDILQSAESAFNAIFSGKMSTTTNTLF